MRDMFGPHPSKVRQGFACLFGVVALAIQIGNHLLFSFDVAFTIRQRFLSDR
jgi:hypothetical protein